MAGKIIVLSAPSGSGKSTIISHLIKNEDLNLGFSISATSRPPRGNEQNGREYFFLTPQEFKNKVENEEFIEWEEVYQDVCYGTLESEVKRITESGKNLVMDVDVKGALSIKSKYGNKVLTLFIMPPDIETLEKRLRLRGTDNEETITKRLRKSEYEMSFAKKFDSVIVNDNLKEAVDKTRELISGFINKDR